MTFMTERLLIPNIVENWVLLIDLKNIGMTDVPISKMKALVSSGQENFPCHFAKTYCVNANWQSKSVFFLCNVAMDECTKAKICVCGSDLSKDLHVDIDVNCLEKKFGGNLPDLEGDNAFFPPDMTMPGENMLPSNLENKRILLE